MEGRPNKLYCKPIHTPHRWISAAIINTRFNFGAPHIVARFKMTFPNVELMQTIKSSTNQNKSQIQEFFENKNVFITGGTGFVGGVLIEKLLRSCPGIKKIYLAARPRRGKDPAERIAAILAGPLFVTLAREMPDFAQKVTFVSADLELPGCGISSEDEDLLRREIDVVFHVAANVRFDNDLRTAVRINVRATRDIIKMAHRMHNLQAFVYVSTAFSNWFRAFIREEIYDPILSGNAGITLAEEADSELLAKLAPVLFDPRDIYLWSKCLAEDVIRKEGEGLPIAVLRPSMVISTAKSPIPGWINNYYGPTYFLAEAFKGSLKTFRVDGDLNANVVPVDYVTNAVIACAWSIGTRNPPIQKGMKDEIPLENNRKTVASQSTDSVDSRSVVRDSSSDLQRKDQVSSIPVYNLTPLKENRLTWKGFFEKSVAVEQEYPLKSAVWCPSFTCSKSKASFLLKHFFLHFLPALISDCWFILRGDKPRLLKTSRQNYKVSYMTSMGFRTRWEFQEGNVARLWEKLNETDKGLFYFNLRDLNWGEYIRDYVLGIREYLIREPMDSVSEGRQKRRRFLTAQYTLGFLAVALFLSTLYQYL